MKCGLHHQHPQQHRSQEVRTASTAPGCIISASPATCVAKHWPRVARVSSPCPASIHLLANRALFMKCGLHHQHPQQHRSQLHHQHRAASSASLATYLGLVLLTLPLAFICLQTERFSCEVRTASARSADCIISTGLHHQHLFVASIALRCWCEFTLPR